MAGPVSLSPNIQAVGSGSTMLDSVVPNLRNIIQALDIIHSPTSTNAIRQQASEFLESQKHAKSAADTGYALAIEKIDSPILRHFGLSLLEHFLRHNYSHLSEEEQESAKGKIILLAKSISPQDESFIGNKVALLWVEGAKCSWGAGKWTEMDADLIQIWNMSWAHKKLVLSILETLSDDIFNHDDKTSSSHETPLHRALVEIVPPNSVFEELHPGRDHHTELRYRSHDSRGWLFMTCDLLSECLNNIQSSREAKICAIQALATLRSLILWSNPLAISRAMCVEMIFKALVVQDDDILMAAIDALHALYSRNHDMMKFQDLVNLVYQTQNIHVLQNLYNWSIVDVHDISVSKYNISKKLSELISYIAGFLEEKNFDFHKDIDLATFFPFLMNILQHPSLTVSIPILHSWSRLLALSKITGLDVIHRLIAPILETCTQRLVRYETLPEDIDDPTIIFLNEDIDTIPERHAFVGNYRRYCAQTIELIVYRCPHDAIPHILARADYVLNNLYNATAPFNPTTFKKHSLPLLQADTQFTVVEATLRGFSKWVEAHGNSPQQDEQQRLGLESSLESWALNLMQKNFQDPVVKERVIRLSVDFCYKALKNNQSFALKVLEHILTTSLPDLPEYPAYSEAVKELHNTATYEVRRLTIRYADYFSTFYDVLEQKIQEIVSMSSAEDKPQMELSSILLIIMQRAPQVDPTLRQSRLRLFIEPIIQSWSSGEFRQISASFGGFCQLLGLDQIWPYLQRVQAQKVEDWSMIPLDEEGRKIQAHMTSKFQQLPLRMTKTMLSVSTEKLQTTDPAYLIACDLWRDSIPLILPTLLQLLSHAHAFHNSENCPGLPQDMAPLVGRILTDRFWQAGISSGSKEDFYARITTSKSTLEGFSSSVRGKVRAVREACYSILYSMSRLREHFYSFEELPVPLSQALFKDATSLSCHQLSVLLNVSRCIVDDCPARYRRHFLPPILSALFIQIDKKITAEWDMIEHRKAGMVESDLTVEMKDESILRQLTYSVVIMVASLLDPQRGDPEKATDPSKQNGTANQPSPGDSIRRFILSSPQILEPVILFCTHAIRMKDTRCCAIITRVIRSILDVFILEIDDPTAKSIREFISTDILKACITSVHEPYFVDMQKELAQLIASIWIVYGATSDTPTKIIESLPDMSKSKVAATYAGLRESRSSRQQKVLVLGLLEGLRGVSISEQGRIAGPPPVRRKPKSALQERYTTEMEGQEGGKVDINNGPDLTGVADMFSL
ncbi:nuclear import and export protein Msn5 [Histoplasma capsulatum G186AR]|uniref:Nuclear import and export protein Msn5 n=1 Tax=Ajellomyces capsulatus TaxID=5037 RepID=A0A8H8CTY5_AJECA|nr:nuclear import and export protein Msn5 [Histoplasma capsulatum]QSS71238.1 nuclear import and export protein Msn5 [Histoplasma capsulatum G186AR]